MANAFDVAGRLAEGSPTVEDIGEYVAAAQRLGYEHRDLTAYPAQVHEWYGSEDGLDLRALDADHDALAAAASAAEDAVGMQVDLMADLDAAWSGRGATSAREFLWRSVQSATAVSAAVRAAATATAILRDALWQAVDAKVSATETVDDGQRPQRGEWLAAATTVTTGGGDVATASELVDQRVRPFVELAVGSGWVAAMREATAAVDSAYDAAIAALASPPVVFAVPGALGLRVDGVAVDPAPVHTVPAAAVGSAPSAGVPTAGAPAAAVPAAAVPAAAVPAAAPIAAPPPSTMSPSTDLGAGGLPAGSMGSGGMGSGAGGLGGLGGLGQQLADLIGGLIGSSDTGLGGNLDEPMDLDEEPIDEEPADDPDEPDDPPGDDEPDDEGEDEPDDEAADDDELGDLPAESAPTESEVVPGTPSAPAPPAPAPPEPPPAVAPEPLAQDATRTPCEIAADELPQVGE